MIILWKLRKFLYVSVGIFRGRFCLRAFRLSNKHLGRISNKITKKLLKARNVIVRWSLCTHITPHRKFNKLGKRRYTEFNQDVCILSPFWITLLSIVAGWCVQISWVWAKRSVHTKIRITNNRTRCWGGIKRSIIYVYRMQLLTTEELWERGNW